MYVVCGVSESEEYEHSMAWFGMFGMVRYGKV
jgi:hypothetical protein